MSNKKTVKYVFSALLVVLLISAGLIFLITETQEPSTPPQSFLEARRDAATISQEIVRLTGETATKISQVDKLVEGDDKERVFSLITEAKGTNNEAHKKAFELSRVLQSLTESLGEIDSIERIELAYNAIATELGLVNEFIIYTEKLGAFLSDLKSAVLHATPESRSKVSASLRAVNEKAGTINELNSEFLNKMKNFDDSF